MLSSAMLDFIIPWRFTLINNTSFGNAVFLVLSSIRLEFPSIYIFMNKSILHLYTATKIICTLNHRLFDI